MRLKFKLQGFQTDSVLAVTDCFAGQPLTTSINYRIDPGRRVEPSGQQRLDEEITGFKNADLALSPTETLTNIQSVQQRQNLPLSTSLKQTSVSPINLDIEMETGTGKTYCYVKTMFELNKQYGWSKFIVVVPSIAIREGVKQSFANTEEHFLQQYGKKARHFIYNSKQLHNLESFSSDAGINVMIINVQAFNARGQDARRIYEELDDFQTRRPIDVISRNRPILILDEPQKMEGAKTLESLKEFHPLFVLRYSATHKQEHNKVYRLDALDAYNQKLVKKIAVRGISVKGLSGTNGYLYLESIDISPNKAPEARVELEIRQTGGIKRVRRILKAKDNLHDTSSELEQYKGYIVSDINAIDNTLSFTNGVVLQLGEAYGDVNEAALRRIQIREAIKAHFDKERELFPQGVKVLSLFFIDEVAKYRRYDDTEEVAGEYAQIFEEEYNLLLNQVLTLEDSAYNRYLRGMTTPQTHEGYFSIDKKSKRLIDPVTGAKSTEADDVDAYDRIIKHKEKLLHFDDPIRFIFSHSALREGWDNPNVFVICALKHADPANVTTRRQEVGRGLRLCVNQNGDRMDNPATVHETNVLTVVAAESYKDFVAGLQSDIRRSLSTRPRKADEAYFTGKVFQTENADITVTPQMARSIYKYLLKNDYIVGDNDQISTVYHDAKKEGTLAVLPADLERYATQIFQLIDGVFDDSKLPEVENGRTSRINPLNSNYEKKEFQELWAKINRKAAYTVHFDTAELIDKCIAALNSELKVSPLQYTIHRGQQTDNTTYEALEQGEAFQLQESQTSSLNASIGSAVKYDLIGKIAGETKLTRSTVGTVLYRIHPKVFSQYQVNPEDFMRQAARLMNEQKATVIVQHLAYNPLGQTFNSDIFTAGPKQDLSTAFPATRHIYDYVLTDSAVERNFAKELDTAAEVVVYAKLPRSFFIPTPVGDYNPDWAIAFQDRSVKHVYFIAETKGSLSSMQLREIEKSKIDCARKFFSKITSEQVRYDVVDSYGKLMELVKQQ